MVHEGQGNPVEGSSTLRPLAMGLRWLECAGCPAGGVLAGPHTDVDLG